MDFFSTLLIIGDDRVAEACYNLNVMPAAHVIPVEACAMEWNLCAAV